jgi:hypothetical protein
MDGEDDSTDETDETFVSIKRIPTGAFGREFTDIPEHVRDNLDSLEREGVVYADHWIEELGDFRHVRIPFTEDERLEFARRSWAYELFLRAGCPQWARETSSIDQAVAAEADSYAPMTSTGVVLEPPYHCFAAFLGSHLEQLICSNTRAEVIEFHGKQKLLFDVSRVIESLTPTIRSFGNREKGLAPWQIQQEDDVRDLLYVMLRPIIFDLIKEEAVPSRAGTHKFIDLCSNAVKLAIEVKWIGRRSQWRRTVEEIHVDIQTYAVHPSCETLIFVVADAARDIQDPRRMEHELSGEQSILGKRIDVRTFIIEP